MTFHRTVAISAAWGDPLSGRSDDTTSFGTTVYSCDHPFSTAFPIASRTATLTRYVPGADGAQTQDADSPSCATFSSFPSATRNAYVRFPTPPFASTLHRTVAIIAACGDFLLETGDETSSFGATVYSCDQPLSAAFPSASRTTAFTRYVPGVFGDQAHKAEGPSCAAISVFPSESRNANVRSPTPPCASTFHRTVAISAACGEPLSGVTGETSSIGTTVYSCDQPLSTAFPIASRTTTLTRYVPGADGAQAHDADSLSCATFSFFPSATRNAYVRFPAPPFASTCHRTVAISAACGEPLSGVTGET